MELQNLLEVLTKAIYPQVRKNGTNMDSKATKIAFEDMTCVFYFEMPGKDKLFLMDRMQDVLKEDGYDLRTVALENYKRDLVMKPDRFLYKGEQGDIELVMVYGTLNMGAVLLCEELLKKIHDICKGDYMVLGVLEDALILAETGKSNEMAYGKRLREEIKTVLEEAYLTDCIFVYQDRKLKNLETGKVLEWGNIQYE